MNSMITYLKRQGYKQKNQNQTCCPSRPPRRFSAANNTICQKFIEDAFG